MMTLSCRSVSVYYGEPCPTRDDVLRQCTEDGEREADRIDYMIAILGVHDAYAYSVIL